MDLSSGAKRDIMIVKFCKALLDVAKQYETISDTEIAKLEGEMFDLSYEITRNIKR